MLADTILLADYASVHDGKLFVHGGGITRLDAHELPLVLPTLAVVARIRIDDDAELDVPHRYSLKITGPNDELVVPESYLDSVAEGEREELPPGEDRYVQLVIAMGGLVFRSAGPHRVQLSVDESPLVGCSFAVVKMGPPAAVEKALRQKTEPREP